MSRRKRIHGRCCHNAGNLQSLFETRNVKFCENRSIMPKTAVVKVGYIYILKFWDDEE